MKNTKINNLVWLLVYGTMTVTCCHSILVAVTTDDSWRDALDIDDDEWGTWGGSLIVTQVTADDRHTMK